MDSIENFLAKYIFEKYAIKISESHLKVIIGLLKKDRNIKEHLSTVVHLSEVDVIYSFFTENKNVILYEPQNIKKKLELKSSDKVSIIFNERVTETDLLNIDALLSFNDKVKILEILRSEKSFDVNLSNLLYGSKVKFLYFIKTYRELFYYFFMFLTSFDERTRKDILKQLEKLDGSNVFINFLQNGIDYSTESCKIINLESVKYYESYEKTRKDYSFVDKTEHVYNLDVKIPQEFLNLFEDSFELNDVQKSVSNVALYSFDNFLVCAPTGCGKTIIAAMVIFSQIQKNKNVKIAYIAPMKALVNEVYQYFCDIFKKLGFYVVEVSSDNQLSFYDIQKASIFVGTPEKIDILIRNSFISFDVFIFDEIHLLNETRGYVIEGLVSRIRRRSKSRIVAMSATLSNYEDVGMFIGATIYNIFNFDNSFRPCPLEYEVIHTFNLDLELADRLSQEEGPFLIFTSTKNNTIRIAESLKTYYEKIEVENFDYETLLDPKIRELAKYGIGIHHAGLSRETRQTIENAFKNGVLNILISTSTLAWGVNLPIKTVIINGSKFYNAEVGEYVELSNMNILQMFGRAGRLKQIGTCKGILISEDISNFYFEQSIESHLLPNLCNLLLAEIVLGISSFKEALEWFKNTFYYTRLVKINQDAFKISKDIVHSALKALDSQNLITYKDLIHPTHLGKIGAKYFVDYKDIGYLNVTLRPEMLDSYLIDSIAELKEFKNIKYTLDIDDFPIPTRTDFGKLIQLYIIGYKDFENDEFLNTINLLDQNLERIFECVFEVATYKKLYSSKQILEFIKSLRHKFFMYQTPLRHFMKQENKLKSIETKNIPFSILKTLSKKDFEELNIEGHEYLRFFPKFEIKFSVYFEDENSFYINLEIEKEFKSTKTDNHKYHLFLSNPYEPEILLYELLYFDKESDCYILTYNIKKTTFLECSIVSDEYIGVENTIIIDVREFVRKDKKLLQNVFQGIQVYDISTLDIRKDVLVTRTTKDKHFLQKLGYIALTYNEFSEEFHKYESVVILDVHNPNYYHSVERIIEICKDNNINFILTGLRPKHIMNNFVSGSVDRQLNVYTSYFSRFYPRLYDLIRTLNSHLSRKRNSKNLIIVPTIQIYEICMNIERDSEACTFFSKEQTNYVIFSDINPLSSIDRKSIFDYVYILDTQYFDYSSKQYVNYKLSDLCYFSYLGRICNLYVSNSKRELYLTNGSLGVLYDNYDTRNYEKMFTGGTVDLGLSSNSMYAIDEYLKNNMGMKNIASLLCQLDEFYFEITDPKLKNIRNCELGLNYLIIDSLISNKSFDKELTQNFYETVLKDVKYALSYMIQISSNKMFLKTMFNIVFLLQNLFKNFVKKKFFEIITEDKEILLVINDVPHIEGSNVTFFIFYEDSSFSLIQMSEKGKLKIDKKNLTCYVLSDCWGGYQII